MDKGAEKRKNNPLKIELKSTQGLYMSTVNPCNDFLVDFLIASKLKSEKQGIGKFTTYNLAIQSVRKYPLPLICEAQLAALQGFGQFFINQGAKRIQKHYKRGRLPTPEQVREDDEQHFAALQANRRKGYNKKKKTTQSSHNEQQNNEDQYQHQQQKVKEEDTNKKNGYNKNTEIKNKEMSIIKDNPQNEREIQNFLKAMYIMSAKYKCLSKDQLNQYFASNKQNQIKNWQNQIKICLQNNYIQYQNHEEQIFRLTAKGLNYIKERRGSQIRAEKEKFKNILIAQQAKIFKLNEIGGLKICSYDQNFKISLIFNKTMKLNQQQYECLTKFLDLFPNPNHECIFQTVEMASFLWKIHDQILEYIVQRIVIKQDVSQEEFIDKLIIQCAILKISHSKNIILIIESQVNFKQLPQAIKMKLYYCVASGFRLRFTKTFQQTLKYIYEMTNLLKTKYKNINQQNGIDVVGSIQKIEKKVKQAKMVSTFFTRCMIMLGLDDRQSQAMRRKFAYFKKMQQTMKNHSLRTKLNCLTKILYQKMPNTQETNQKIKRVLDFIQQSDYQQIIL